MEHTDDNTTIIGTISGTLLSVGVTIDTQDYLKTIVLAAVGAVASIFFSPQLIPLKKVQNKKKSVPFRIHSLSDPPGA